MSTVAKTDGMRCLSTDYILHSPLYSPSRRGGLFKFTDFEVFYFLCFLNAVDLCRVSSTRGAAAVLKLLLDVFLQFCPIFFWDTGECTLCSWIFLYDIHGMQAGLVGVGIVFFAFLGATATDGQGDGNDTQDKDSFELLHVCTRMLSLY